MVELEPIGPREILQPGASAAFTETWYLQKFEFPADRHADLGQVEQAVRAQLQ